MVKCPVCNRGTLKLGTKKESMFGVDLGEFPAEICSSCGESFMDSKTMREVEAKAKAKGIWGLSTKTKITRTGNSLAIRIPKKIADYLKLKEGNDAYIHPEKDKFVVEQRI